MFGIPKNSEGIVRTRETTVSSAKFIPPAEKDTTQRIPQLGSVKPQCIYWENGKIREALFWVYLCKDPDGSFTIKAKYYENGALEKITVNNEPFNGSIEELEAQYNPSNMK
jgi:hypothetical protein